MDYIFCDKFRDFSLLHLCRLPSSPHGPSRNFVPRANARSRVSLALSASCFIISGRLLMILFRLRIDDEIYDFILITLLFQERGHAGLHAFLSLYSHFSQKCRPASPIAQFSLLHFAFISRSSFRQMHHVRQLPSWHFLAARSPLLYQKNASSALSLPEKRYSFFQRH